MGDFFGIFIVTNIIYLIPMVTDQFFPSERNSVRVSKIMQKVFYSIAFLCSSAAIYLVYVGVDNSNPIAMMFGVFSANFIWYFIYSAFVSSALKNEENERAELLSTLHMTPKQLKVHEDDKVKLIKDQKNESYFGKINKQLVCPHCNKKGLVRKSSKIRTTKTRVNSVAGRAIGLGTNTDSAVTAFRCDNCETQWDVV